MSDDRAKGVAPAGFFALADVAEFLGTTRGNVTRSFRPHLEPGDEMRLGNRVYLRGSAVALVWAMRSKEVARARGGGTGEEAEALLGPLDLAELRWRRLRYDKERGKLVDRDVMRAILEQFAALHRDRVTAIEKECGQRAGDLAREWLEDCGELIDQLGTGGSP